MSELSHGQDAEDKRIRQAAVDFLAELAGQGTIEDDFEVGEVLHGPEPDTMRLVIKARMTFPVPVPDDVLPPADEVLFRHHAVHLPGPLRLRQPPGLHRVLVFLRFIAIPGCKMLCSLRFRTAAKRSRRERTPACTTTEGVMFNGGDAFGANTIFGNNEASIGAERPGLASARFFTAGAVMQPCLALIGE